MLRERLNRKFALGAAVAVVVIGTSYAVVNRVQVQRQAGALLTQADRAEEQGQFDRAEQYLYRYLLQLPQDAGARARYGLLLDKRAQTPQERRKVLETFEHVLIRDPERHDIRRRAALLAMDLGRLDVALAHLPLLVKAFPKDADLTYRLGLCQEVKQAYSEAASAYKLAIAAAPQQVESYRQLAYLLRQRLQQPDAADQLMDQLVAANPRSFRAYLTRAAYRRQEASSAAGAAQDVAEALRLAPEDADVLLLAAELAQQQGKLDEARALLVRGLKQQPQQARLYQAQVELELRAGRTEPAWACLRRGLEAAPGDKNLLWTSAQLLLDEGKVGDARARLEQLRRTDLPPERLDLLAARLLFAEGNWLVASQGLELLRPRLLKAPDLALQTDLLLGQCFERLGDPDRQLEAFQRASTSQPFHVAARQGCIAALLALGGLDEALGQARQLVQLPQAPAAGWTQLAWLLILHNQSLPAAQQKWAEMEMAIARAEKANPKTAAVPLLRAEMLTTQGRFDPARQLLETARRQHPKDTEVWISLARSVRRTGGPEAALRLLAEAEGQVGDRVDLRLARVPYLFDRGLPEQGTALKRLERNLGPFTPAERGRLLRALAGIQYQLGKDADAERLWQQAALLQPHDLDIRVRLFELALRQGDEALRQQRLEEIRSREGAGGPLGRYAEACALLEAGRHGDRQLLARARTQLTVVAGQRPSWRRVPLRLAELDELEGNPEPAIEHYRRALDLGERRVPVVRRLVGLLSERQRYAEAEDVLRRLQDQGPLAHDLQRAAAEISLQKLEPERALEWAHQAVASDAKDYREHLWLGQVLAAAGRKAEAEAAFRRATQLGGKHADPWVVLVRYYVKAGQVDQADKTLREAQGQVAPEEAPLALAACYEALARLERADEPLRKALTARPDDLALLLWVGQFYLRTGQPRKAIPPLRKFLEPRLQAPAGSVTWVRRRLAAALVEAGGNAAPFREALALLADNQRQNGDNPEDQRVRARVLATRPGHRQEAIRLFEELRPRSALTTAEEFRLALLYEAEGNGPKARAGLLRVVSADAGNPLYLARCVRSLLRQGALDEAQIWLAKLEQLRPGSPEATTLQARLLAARHQEDEALALLKRYAGEKPAEPGQALPRLLLAASLLEELSRDDLGSRSELAQAAEELYRTYAARSTKPDGLVLLSRYLTRQGRIAEALDVCERAMPAHAAGVVTAVAGEVVRSGPANASHMRRVDQWLTAALEKKPNDVVLLNQLATLRGQQARYAEAEALYRQVIAQDGRNLEALNNLAYQLALLGEKGAEALELSQRCLDLAGPQAALLDTRGIARLAVGQTEAAIKDLEEAVAEMPEAAMYLHLAGAYQRTGRRDAALAALQKAQTTGLVLRELHPLDRAGYEHLRIALDVR